ncbi:MAG: Uma2 family endonuclease [Planctomycetales bacterium]|nr:Uma2 family endonuclease [Planctomycetales bacterium]
MSTVNDPKTKLTYDDYVLIPNDGNRHEIIDGCHYMNPAPHPNHQTASRFIQHQLMNQIEIPGLGQVFNAPCDVQLSDYDVVQPDLVIVLKTTDIVIETRIRGVPDLVVEVLSPSTRKYDQEVKKQLYLKHQIPEYWIVDSKSRTVERNVLNKHGEFVATVCSKTISCEHIDARVDLEFVWNRLS